MTALAAAWMFSLVSSPNMQREPQKCIYTEYAVHNTHITHNIANPCI